MAGIDLGSSMTVLMGLLKLVGMIFLYVALAILIVAMLGSYWYFVIYRKRLYTTDCIIVVDRQGHNVIGFDKGGYITKKKSTRFKLLKRKKARTSPPKYKSLMMSETGRNILFLYKYGERDYSCLDLTIENRNKLILVPMDGLSIDATIQDIRDDLADLMSPSFWEKYALPIMLLLGIIIIMAGLYFSISLLSKQIATASQNSLQATKMMADALNAFNKTAFIVGH